MTRTVVRGVGLAGGGYVVGQAINLAVYVVLARLVTPEEFGQFAAGAVLVQAGLYLTDSGLSAAVIQRRDRIEEAASTAVVATVLAGIGLGLAALAASPLIGRVFQSHQVTLVAAAASGWIVVRSFAIIPDALMQRRFSFVRRAVIDPLGIVVFGAVAIIATAQGMGVWGLVLGNYAQFAIMSVSSWALARWRPRLGLASVAMWRELVRFGRHVMASGVLATVSTVLSTTIIGRFFGTATLGQFRYGARIVQTPLGALINAGSYVLFPAFSRISSDAQRLQRGFLRAVRVTFSIATPISLLLLPLGVPLAVLLFGEQWHEAGTLAAAMFAYTGARAYISLTREIFKASGRTEILTKLQTVSGVLTLGLMVAAVPLGSTAVGAAVSLSSIGTAAYATHAVAQTTEIPVQRIVGEMWPPLATSALMAGGLFGVELLVDADAHGTAAGLALLAAEGLLGMGIYLGALAVVAPAHMRELVALAEHLPGRLRRRARPTAALEPESNAAAPLP